MVPLLGHSRQHISCICWVCGSLGGKGPYWPIGAGASKMLMVMVKMLLVKKLMVMVMAKMLIISCICWVCGSLGGRGALLAYWQKNVDIDGEVNG